MRKIVLISCVKTKLNHAALAKDLYVSQLFKSSLAYARSLNPDAIYILSAKYGVVKLDQEIEPYEMTLNKMPVDASKEWAKNVVIKLKEVADLEKDKIIFIAGEKYRRFLIPHIRNYEIPLKGLSFGNQLKYMKAHTK